MKQFKRLIIPYFIWAIVILVIPLFLIALYAFTTEGNEVMTLSFTWGNFAKFLEATYLNVILKSFWLGLLTTFICLVLGYPLALIIARCSEKVQGLLIMLVTIPMWINMLLRTYAWMNLLADNGIINNLLAKIGLGPISMMYTDFSVMVGLICNFMPFMIIPIHTSLNKMDKSLIEAAYDLGANRFQTFWKVIWKLSLPGVVNGIMMVFLLAISSFVIPKLLVGRTVHAYRKPDRVPVYLSWRLEFRKCHFHDSGGDHFDFHESDEADGQGKRRVGEYHAEKNKLFSEILCGHLSGILLPANPGDHDFFL